jgi:hypothetical protein
MTIRPYGPGKFNTILDSVVYEWSAEWIDDEFGDCDQNGIWYGLMTDISPASNDTEELNDDERAFLRGHVGAIISENDQGFVDIEYFTGVGSLQEAWAEIELSLDPECAEKGRE